ncbi:DUF397 domain-containing protein [Streptomyces sp. PU-14G]|uniref:DUF397 domain-containing protein n=1 Tax=Streptomyces sp. PU-14G TaxID=2800808 RepID=UPI0034DE1AA2
MSERTLPDASMLHGWRKSSYSNDEGGSCLEVLDTDSATIPVRDSKNPHGPALLLPSPAWTSFIDSLKASHYHG